MRVFARAGGWPTTPSRRGAVLPVRVLRPRVARSDATMRRTVERLRRAKLVGWQAVLNQRAERLGTDGARLNPEGSKRCTELAGPHLVCSPISAATSSSV